MPQLDTSVWPPQLFWLAISFALLYFVVSRLIVPRTGGVIELRKTTVAADLAAAGRDKTESEATSKSYQASLADSRAKANESLRIARDKLTADSDAARAKLDAELAGKVASSEKQIAAAKSKALAGIDDVAADIASSIVERLTGAKATQAALTAAVTKAAK
jgi:F-type H+-transporting ATPase subunit b